MVRVAPGGEVPVALQILSKNVQLGAPINFHGDNGSAGATRIINPEIIIVGDPVVIESEKTDLKGPSLGHVNLEVRCPLAHWKIKLAETRQVSGSPRTERQTLKRIGVKVAELLTDRDQTHLPLHQIVGKLLFEPQIADAPGLSPSKYLLILLERSRIGVLAEAVSVTLRKIGSETATFPTNNFWKSKSTPSKN